MREENFYRLARPVKKGVLHLVFSRFLIIFLLMVFQVLLLVGMFRWLEEYVPYLTVLQSVFAVGMIIYLFNITMDSSAKLTWLFIIAIFPLPGTVLLAFTRTNLGHRWIKQRVDQLIHETQGAIPQSQEVITQLGDGSGTDNLVCYVNRSGCYPVYAGSQVHYFPLGDDMFPAMLEELEKAEKFIFMEFFIIEEGYMWGKALEILTRKAAQGVDVRVMYDGTCEFFKLPGKYIQLLQSNGIKAKDFAPIRPMISSHYNYRDHRKILVIDGNVAFTGGVNLADEYINRVVLHGHWKDTAIMVQGEAVKSFTLMFLQMWNINETAPEFAPWLEIPAAVPERPSGYVMPYGDSPLDGDRVGESVYIDILYRAGKYVHIMTPYLILDGEMEAALCYAAERGIDVKLILPGIPDKKFVYAMAKTHYARLLESGVEIFEYTPGFVHAKVFVSDDIKAVVGTINLDYRSLYHHFECAAYLYKTDCISDIERDFQETLAKCRQVTPATVANEKLYYKIVGRLMKFAAPLM